MEYSIGILVLIYLCSIFNVHEANRQRRDVRRLLDKYEFNRVLLQSIPRPYQIVFPKQVRRNELVGISTKEHRLRHHGTHEHLKHTTIQLVLDGKKYKIKLERNEALLSAGVKVKHYLEGNQQVITKTVEHCYYHGFVKRDEWSSVAVSTCSGIRGVIQMHNETYVIQPMLGGDEGLQHPHIIFKATESSKEKCGNSVGQWLPFHELHKGEFIRKLKALRAQRTRRGKTKLPSKTIRLALVLDKTMYTRLNLSHTEMTTYSLGIGNIVDLYFRELKIKVALSYLEYWNLADQFVVSGRQRETLKKFLTFKTHSLPDASFDIAYFMTGMDLENDSIGLAIPDSVCTDRAVGICKNPNTFELQQAATVLSHMIGHNLGIEHDEDGDCHCADKYGCIMSTSVLATRGFHSRMFSNCSKSDLDVGLDMEIMSCLEGKPPVNFPQTCGNSIVERGEECDCGSEEDCLLQDPCCDPSTCLLRFWAQCRSGPCCSNCTVLSRDHVCRPRQTECDVPEFCDGERGECPFNNYIQDGHPCYHGTGYCIGGICPTLPQQCQIIWGEDATGGGSKCFERFNPTGNFNGHCGKDENTGNFARCSPENIMCGLLHCEGGNREPLFGPDKDFSKTTVNSHGIEYECKSVHGPAMMDVPHMGLVQDGTKCGDNKVCSATKCVQLTELPPLNCPGTTKAIICSGHGVCTRDDTCFCDDGWTSPDCTVRLNVTSPPPTTPEVSTIAVTTTRRVVLAPVNPLTVTGETTPADPSSRPVLTAGKPGLSTMWLIIILASVVGGLVLILSFTLFCYRRKSPSKLQKAVTKGLLGNKDSSSKKDGSSSSLNSRYLNLGILPSYNPDKLFGKKKKKKKGKHISSEDDSDIGELPPPPIIVSDPNSAMPGRSILKNSMIKLNDGKVSSDSRSGSEQNDDRDSVGPYMYDEDEDLEAEEIREILGEEEDFERSMDALDQLPESASFDFVLPQPLPPHFGMPSLHPSPPLSHKIGRLDLPLMTDYQHQPLLWKTVPHPASPPRSKIVKLKNLNDLLRHIDRHTIDLSPSPEFEPPLQVSPSTCTSEDVRSSETDAHYPSTHTSQSDHSPTSLTSSSTRETTRPGLGNLSQYLLNRRDFMDHQFDDPDLHPPHIDIPPPMNPISLRNIFNIGQTGVHRDNDTPIGSTSGENTSLNGTANSRNGGEKSSGYGSEHDPERFSIEDISRSQSRSQSASPPSYSAVIRTGPNQIKLVPAGQSPRRGGGGYGNKDELHKLLDGLPRIDAGTFERSPIQTNTGGVFSTPSKVGLMKDHSSDLEPWFNSSSRRDDGCSESSSVSSYPCSLSHKDQAFLDSDNTPCIDRSLEEIPQDFSVDMKNAKKEHRKSLIKSKHPASLNAQRGSPELGLLSPESESSRDTVQHCT
ncbi:disintegrin and metalloproteinase domain-containing protein unc-71-like isoform X2 [Gigantopelta aegis]|uniref:disintegrin and metalloproteinase domain-containing protein unc-71-like isoform X2 n=1 Tax=Gigantopelta aegis TaxID=1735272 RepID=UPI001B887629|nr:disintegrin and metalloproteinase domain-containing protein unc-71-like isoform X2 [Gigantopelta aegis]